MPSKFRERQISVINISRQSNIDTNYEKIKIQSLKDKMFQNLRENISEIFDTKLTTITR